MCIYNCDTWCSQTSMPVSVVGRVPSTLHPLHTPFPEIELSLYFFPTYPSAFLRWIILSHPIFIPTLGTACTYLFTRVIPGRSQKSVRTSTVGFLSLYHHHNSAHYLNKQQGLHTRWLAFVEKNTLWEIKLVSKNESFIFPPKYLTTWASETGLSGALLIFFFLPLAFPE